MSFISGFLVMDLIYKTLRIYCYNLVVVFFSKDNKSMSNSKYIDIKYFTLKKRKLRNKNAFEKCKEHVVNDLIYFI